MRHIFFIALALSLSCYASDRHWQDANVLDITSMQTGTQAIALPVGNGIYAASGPTRRSFYRLKGDQYTYVVPNYCKGSFVQAWLRLTIGGTAKISPENSKTLHVIDDDGKERTVSIVQRIVNPAK